MVNYYTACMRPGKSHHLVLCLNNINMLATKESLVNINIFIICIPRKAFSVIPHNVTYIRTHMNVCNPQYYYLCMLEVILYLYCCINTSAFFTLGVQTVPWYAVPLSIAFIPPMTLQGVTILPVLEFAVPNNGIALLSWANGSLDLLCKEQTQMVWLWICSYAVIMWIGWRSGRNGMEEWSEGGGGVVGMERVENSVEIVLSNQYNNIPHNQHNAPPVYNFIHFELQFIHHNRVCYGCDINVCV